MIRFYPLVITSIVLLSVLSSCGNKAAQSSATAVKEYQVFTLKTSQTILYNEFPANLQGQQNVEIRPRVSGYLEEVCIDEGAHVRKGQVLFRIDRRQYLENVRSAEANVAIAEANLKTAEMEVEKKKSLVENKIISSYELESAQYTLASRKGTLAQTKAQLENAKTDLSYTVITSPAEGVAGIFPYKVGSLVSSSMTQPLTTVSNIANIYAYFSVNEKTLLEYTRNLSGSTLQDRLQKMPPVDLILADGTLYTHQGKVETASGLINPETGASVFRATFPNEAEMLRSGGSGLIRIPEILDSALLIPQKATYELQGKYFVYVVGDSAKVKNTEINILPNNDGKNYVVTSGLSAGTQIVTEGVASLRNGTVIKPMEGELAK